MSIHIRRPLIDLETRLRDIPTDWLRYIEPRIMRGSFLPCWVWTGGMDGYGYPMFRNPHTLKYGSVRQFIARMFYDFDDEYVTWTCETRNCLCPGHLLVTEEHPRWANRD